MQPTEYVRSKNWDHKIRGDEINVKICPFCGDQGFHFYMARSAEGLFHCKKCDQGGNLFSLMKHHGDIEEPVHPAGRKKSWSKPKPEDIEAFHRALFSDYEALRYLDSRGISTASINRFKLGVRRKEGKRWLSIPHLSGSEWANVKYRSLPPAEKAFEREFGCRSVLFNSNAVGRFEELIITEGELDAITLLQHGFENVVGATGGAGSFDAAWILELERAKKIFLCYDSDEAGQKGARSVARRLGYNRCWNVVLPAKDANEFFQRHGTEEFRLRLASANQFSLPGIVTARSALDLLQGEIESGEDKGGILTPWENINRIICGWRPGDLIVVTALPKTGKTTFCLEITRDLVLRGIPALFYCLEMRPERLMRKLIQAQYRIENPTLRDMQNARVLFENIPLYFGHAFKFQKSEDLIQAIGEAILRYGIKFAVFDNLHLLCRSDKVNEELSQAILGFKLLAEQTEIPIVVIAQPRKLDKGKSEIMSAEDVRYSSAIHSDCDQMLILHRNRRVSNTKEIREDRFTAKDQSLEPLTLVRVEAHRYGPGGEALLYYKGEQSRFTLVETRDKMRVVGKERAHSD